MRELCYKRSSFHRRRVDATHYKAPSRMKNLQKLVALTIILSLGACAAAPQPDLNPPPRAKADPKTNLESGAATR